MKECPIKLSDNEKPGDVYKKRASELGIREEDMGQIFSYARLGKSMKYEMPVLKRKGLRDESYSCENIKGDNCENCVLAQKENFEKIKAGNWKVE